MKWLLLFTIYVAPNNASNWDGPWKLDQTRVMGDPFPSEANCRNTAIQFIAKMHQGMLAPMRFKCIPIEPSLPKGATR